MPGKCIGDSAYIAAAQTESVSILARGAAELLVTVALALWKFNVGKRITDMQAELAERQVALAETIEGHAASFYGAEAAMVAAAMGEGKATPDRFGMSTGWQALSVEANAAGRADWLKAARAMCMVPDRCDDGRWSAASSRNEIDTANFALRQAEVRSDAHNDRRYARQLGAIGIGQGNIGGAANYSKVAGQLAGNLTSMLNSSINSAAGLLGYAINRAPITPQWGYKMGPQATPMAVAQSNNIDTSNTRNDITVNTNLDFNYSNEGRNSAAPMDTSNYSNEGRNYPGVF